VDGDTADLVAFLLDFSSMQASADLDPEPKYTIANAASATNRAGRPVEGRKESVASRIDLATSEPSELFPNQRVMPLEKLLP
jgi:hypothetical protein